eukprot:4988228-Pyramimonas_sp.AAC.1
MTGSSGAPRARANCSAPTCSSRCAPRTHSAAAWPSTCAGSRGATAASAAYYSNDVSRELPTSGRTRAARPTC